MGEGPPLRIVQPEGLDQPVTPFASEASTDALRAISVSSSTLDRRNTRHVSSYRNRASGTCLKVYSPESRLCHPLQCVAPVTPEGTPKQRVHISSRTGGVALCGVYPLATVDPELREGVECSSCRNSFENRRRIHGGAYTMRPKRGIVDASRYGVLPWPDDVVVGDEQAS